MDGPLSDLDAKTRLRPRAGLRSLQRSLGTTTVLVTHEQMDAMAVADKIVLLADSAIQQAGPPEELYDAPRTAFVAGFMGNPPMNLLPGTVRDGGVWVGGAWRVC